MSIHDDARKLLGLPPHHHVGNLCHGDGYFFNSCIATWGEAAFEKAKREVLAPSHTVIHRKSGKTLATLCSAIEVQEFCEKSQLIVEHECVAGDLRIIVVCERERDPAVELRGLLKEVLDVLQCHHRNTHKPLIERIRTYRSAL